MTLEGVVESRNETGIRLNGEWLNRSKFKPLDLPDVGTHVRAEVDGKGYLQRVEVLDGAAAPSTTNMRLEVLKAAAAFCGAKAAASSEVKSTDVLRIAEAWLAWVHAE